MPTNHASSAVVYAFKIALLYLLVRGFPDLLLYASYALPPETFRDVAERHQAWLFYIFPVTSINVLSVPAVFQEALTLWPVLMVETLLVFLFSIRLLVKKPWAPVYTKKRHWVFFLLATLTWSLLLRIQLLGYLQRRVIDGVMAHQASPGWFDDLPFLLIQSHWILIAALYITIFVWACVPVWLHFRLLKPEAKVASQVESAATDGSPNKAAMVPSTQRATVFASFLLGVFFLHVLLLQVIYMGAWPWLVAQERGYVPLEMIDEAGMLLVLTQIVLLTIVCALAAFVYVRRFAPVGFSCGRLVFKPLLSGVLAYLLTSAIFIALVWLVFWLVPGLGNSLLLTLGYAPTSATVLLIVLNVVAALLLCFLSSGVRYAPRRWSAVLGVLFVFAMVPAYVIGVVVGSEKGLVGSKPGFAVTGQLGDAHWRSMEQWCTGVVKTSQGTWLVGRNETSLDSASYVPDEAFDLSSLVHSEANQSTEQAFSFFGSRPNLSTLALLQDDGQFKLVATMPEVACLMVTPESEVLYLFTGLKTPTTSPALKPAQTAVFRSTDQGATWHWLSSGFMPDVKSLAWSLKPTFASDNEVWAWGDEPRGEGAGTSAWGYSEPESIRQATDGTVLQPTALFYSADAGKTATPVYSPESLVVTQSHLREVLGKPEATFSSGRAQDQERFVVQVDEHRAYAWVSERTWYFVGEESQRLLFTTRAELTRENTDTDWQVSHIERQANTAIEHLVSSLDGQHYAILHDEQGEWLARLDPVQGEWVERQRTPSLFPSWLAGDASFVRYFWSNGDYQVLSMWGDTLIPRILMPFTEEQAGVTTETHYYTRNGGRSWYQLAIPDYLGVMGLAPRGSTLYWTKGDWYVNEEPYVWQYNLAN